jgi:hypothetical protein
MNGNKYIESTARKEIMDLIDRCGPLTTGQIDRIRRKTRSEYTVRWLHRNGYVGMLPTNPVRFCSAGRDLPPPTVTEGMKHVLAALEEGGPCSSWQLAEKIGKVREHIDNYLRAAHKARMVHRIGELERGHRGPGAYIWAIGAGDDYVRKATRVERVVVSPKVSAPTSVVRRDPFIEAMYGNAA